MKLYLDNCCFNRPFDDQSQLRIRLEAEAKLQVQADIRSKQYELIWSYILSYENSRNPFQERRKQIEKWEGYATSKVLASAGLMEIATELQKSGLKKLDALHVACAMSAKADYFLTTDDGVLKKSSLIQDVRILDPIGFIKEVQA